MALDKCSNDSTIAAVGRYSMLSGIFFLYHNAGDVILEFRLAETAWRNLKPEQGFQKFEAEYHQEIVWKRLENQYLK